MKAHLVAILDETPVTAGGLVIREPSPRPRTPECSVSRTTSPQEGAIVLRPANGTSGLAEQRSQSHLSLTHSDWPTPPKHPKPTWHALVTMESVTDEDARQPRPPLQEISPESEQLDSDFGNPAAQSTAQNVPLEETRFHSVLSHPASGNTSKFSQNPPSIEQVWREHMNRAEARAQSAYKQSRVALDLISKSMDNVQGAFTEAKRMRNRFHDILLVSSRSCQSVR